MSKEKVADLIQQAKKGAALAASDTEKWETWLSFYSRFHRYSFQNLMLIMLQSPDATRVAGYRTWQSLGRQVRKGEHGLSILAPCFYKKKTDDEEEQVAYYRSVAVFDLEQTDGDDLPELADESLIQATEVPEKLAALKEIAEAEGYTVTEQVTDTAYHPGVRGWADHTTKAIVLDETGSTGMRMKTLIHELAHMRLHSDGNTEHEARELEAESVAYVVSNLLGVETEGYSFAYLASWSKRDEDALEAFFKASMGRIQDAAEKLVAEVETVLMGLK